MSKNPVEKPEDPASDIVFVYAPKEQTLPKHYLNLALFGDLPEGLYERLLQWLSLDSRRKIRVLCLDSGQAYESMGNRLQHDALNVINRLPSALYQRAVQIRQNSVVSQFDFHAVRDFNNIADGLTKASRSSIEALLSWDPGVAPVLDSLAVGPEELREMLLAPEVYKPVHTVTVEIFDDQPVAVEGLLQILSAWPNVSPVFTPIDTPNADLLQTKRYIYLIKHREEGREFRDFRIVLLDTDMPVRPRELFQECNLPSSFSVATAPIRASISSLPAMEDADLYTHGGFPGKTALARDPLAVQACIAFLSPLLRELDAALAKGDFPVRMLQEQAFFREFVQEFELWTKPFLLVPEHRSFMNTSVMKITERLAAAAGASIFGFPEGSEEDYARNSEERQLDWKRFLFSISFDKNYELQDVLTQGRLVYPNAEVAARWPMQKLTVFMDPLDRKNFVPPESILPEIPSQGALTFNTMRESAKAIADALGMIRKV